MLPKPKRVAAPPFTVPSLSSNTDYAAASAAVAEMRGRLRAAEAERDECLYASANRTFDAKGARVAALLGDTATNTVAPETRISVLNRDIADILSAIVLLEQRRTAARMSASRRVVDVIAPEYARRVSVLAKAVDAALQAHMEFEALRNEIIAEEIAFGRLPIVRANRFLGETNDNDADARRFVRECVDVGLVDGSLEASL